MTPKAISNLLENSNGKQRRAALLCLIVLCGLVFMAYSAHEPKVAPAIAGDTLRVTVLDQLYKRFDSPGTPGYLNILLANEFATLTGSELKLQHSNDYAEAVEQLRAGQTDLILSNDIEAEVYPYPQIKSIPVQDVALLLIGIQGPAPAPEGIADLRYKSIAVSHDSGIATVLKKYHQRWPEIELIATRNRSTPELMDMVTSNQVRYTVVQSNEFLMLQHFFPDLISRYELEGTFSVGWLTSTRDPVFVQRLEQFMRDVKSSGRMQALAESNQGHLWNFNYSEAKLFLHRVNKDLPDYRKYFEQAGKSHDVDWRLLAAIAHQESHWDPAATSPTGVRGMMMLTQTTAAEMGVVDRLSAEQSISGGARYYRRLYDLLPDDLPDPHKTWMALASYNLGRGHVLRARQLAENAGSDNNDWQQLREFILALENGTGVEPPRSDVARYTSDTVDTNAYTAVGANTQTSTDKLNGRGLEAIRYVDNVRRYYDMLVWISENEPGEKPDEKSSKDPHDESNNDSSTTTLE